MAKVFTNSLLCSNTTTATFRAWAAFLDSIFSAGLVNVTDAAQINLTSVAIPTLTYQSMGFRIYRTDDALTTIYIKIEFGSGAAAANPSFWLTIGTTYTVGGTIGGVVLLPRQNFYATANDITTSHVCFGSSGVDRLCFAMFTGSATHVMWFSFERRKDATIANVDTGVIFDGGFGTGGHWSQCVPFTGVIPTAEKGMQFILSTNNPAAYGALVPEGLRIPCLGPSEPPGLNVAVCTANDYGSYAEPTLSIATVNHAFKQCGPNITTLRGATTGVVDVNTRLLLRYE